MDYSDYKFIIDLLDDYQSNRERDFRRALSMGAKHDDIIASLHRDQTHVSDLKQILRECASAHVKVKHPDDIALQNFWNPPEQTI